MTKFLWKTIKTSIKSHDFRTTKISELLENKEMGIKDVQLYIGHKNVATTLGYQKID